MDERWYLETIEVRNGFLDGLALSLPRGLTCIIGPRGSGKSTLAEVIRYAFTGMDNARKERMDLYKTNLSRSVLIARTYPTADGNAYVVRREPRQTPIVATATGRALPSLDLDRGTFLPIDAFNSFEIEQIADESFSGARRSLLDQLAAPAIAESRDRIARAERLLASNADEIRACRRERDLLIEQSHALGHAREHFASFPRSREEDDISIRLRDCVRQSQINLTEKRALIALRSSFDAFLSDALALTQRVAFVNLVTTQESSHNSSVTERIDNRVAQLSQTVSELLQEAAERVRVVRDELIRDTETLEERHAQQGSAYATLRDQNVVAGEAARRLAEAAAAVQALEQVEARIEELREAEARLSDARRELRRDYNLLCDEVSAIRGRVAAQLQAQAGHNVRIRVRRNADRLTYQQQIAKALHGQNLRQHDAIVEAISKLRPDELSQLIDHRNEDELDRLCEIGPERAHRVMEGLRSTIDALDLETLALDDEISIELNVGSTADPLFRDASQLSRGQKCTALLPLLLARREVPLVIDQPEDNLDNHFIFNTVVDTILRVKAKRQMIFITHNANIPVLGDADLVVVLDSDGEKGFIRKAGSLDECRHEIIDLLEGGEDAFDKRRQRYGR